MIIFTILVLPVLEHEIIPHLFVLPVFFHQCLIVFCIKILVSLRKFVLGILFILLQWWMEFFFFINLYDFSLLMYVSTRNFSALILYPATILSSAIGSSNFLVVSLWISMYSIMLSGNSEFSFFSNPYSFHFLFDYCGYEFQNLIG